MNRRTTWILALCVLLLGFVTWWQTSREGAASAEMDLALFEGVDKDRVTALRVENIERDIHMRLERDAQGRWTMTDPVTTPADEGLANFLLQSALDRHATPVPERESDVHKLGLEPPRIVLEIEEALVGERKRSRIELGGLDPDGQRVNVRVRGRLVRALRDLDTTLSRPLDDFKSHSAMAVGTRDIIELHRRGRMVREGETSESDLTLEALLDGATWRITAPVQAALDPMGVSLWISGAADLRIENYVDQGSLLLSQFGLDPPEMSVELGLAQGDEHRLRFGRPGHAPGGAWYCTREGQPWVWTLDARAVNLLSVPIEDLIDHRLLRLARSAIDGLTLRSLERELHLSRRARDWQVAARVTGERSYGPPVPADTGKVEDILARIDRTEFVSLLLNEKLEEKDARGALHVEAGPETAGGIFGGEVTGDKGGKAVRFRRDGDNLTALCDPSLFDLVRIPVEELWSLRLRETIEVDQRELKLSGAGTSRSFVHGSKGLWTHPDLAVEARELHEVLDSLLFVRAARHLPRGRSAVLQDPVQVEFTDTNQKKSSYVIGQAPEAAGGTLVVQIEVDGRRAVLMDQELHRKLLSILGQEH